MKRFYQNYFRYLLPGLIISGALEGIAAPGQTHALAEDYWPTNSYWTMLSIDSARYDTPYRIALFNPQNSEDGARAWSQTKSVFVYGLGVVGFLAVLPEQYTDWDTDPDIFKKWVNNVKEGPEWDRNNWAYNYIGHAYFGGVYYQVIRKSGYRQWDAFVYSFLMSTFYWEYGIEAFAETPSIQDLAFTPLLGWIYGEWAYQTELRIRDGNGKVGGSKILGDTVLFLLDPIDSLGRGVNRVAGRRLIKSGSGYFTYNAVPNGNATDHQVYLNMNFPLGGSNQPDRYKISHFDDRNDPVDTGIIGIALGTGHTFLDKDWGVEDDFYSQVSMGLYFTPRFSARLAYAWGDLMSQTTGKPISHENYSLDAQYYLNAKQKLRPFVTAGFGEQLWDKNNDSKAFLWNAGVGLHWKLHDKWALQADWIHYYSPSRKTYDQSINTGLVYRFGQGEHDAW